MKYNKALYILLFAFTSSVVKSKFIQPRTQLHNEGDDLDDNRNDISEKDAPDSNNYINNVRPLSVRYKKAKANGDNVECWMDLDVKRIYEAMDKLDANYDKARTDYHKAVGIDNFDKEMLKTILKDQGKSQRTLHHSNGDPGLIPAGLNLGGYNMMPMKDSMLFFHRMKLRNSTNFRINYLHNDLYNMVLSARLSLNDLHLLGSFERAGIVFEPSYLLYKPTFGQVEILLKDAEYKMEGRYRLLNDRLVIDLILSDITVKDITATYHHNATSQSSEKLDRRNIDDFLLRMKLDLDKWLKDYFNDYLTLFELPVANSKGKFLTYDKKKAMILNEYVDDAIDLLKHRMRKLKSVAVNVPDFTILTSNGMSLKLRDGVLRGLDSMHRRSVASGKKDNAIRFVDAVVGFSKLKLEYRYEGYVMPGQPYLNGLFVLTADELTAHMGLALVKDPEAFDLKVEFMEQNRPESLTVEGPINTRIPIFKHLLENHIISIMSNMLLHHIRLLSRLNKCGSSLPPLSGHVDTGEIFSDEDPFDQDRKYTPDPVSKNSTEKHDAAKNITITKNKINNGIIGPTDGTTAKRHV